MSNVNMFEFFKNFMSSKIEKGEDYINFFNKDNSFLNYLTEADKNLLDNLDEDKRDMFSQYALDAGQSYAFFYIKSLVLEEKLNNPNLVDEVSAARILELEGELTLTKRKLKLSEKLNENLQSQINKLNIQAENKEKEDAEYKLRVADQFAEMRCEINRLNASNYKVSSLPKNATQKEVADALGVSQPTISYRRNKALLRRDEAAKTVVLHRQRIINLFGSETKFLEFQVEFISIYKKPAFIKRANSNNTHRQAINNIINEFGSEAQSLFMELTKDYKLSPCDGHIVFDFHKYLNSSHRVIKN